MDQPTSRAGGCLIAICLLGGFVLGLTTPNPLRGVLGGLVVGIVLAVIVWLIDRRRTGE